MKVHLPTLSSFALLLASCGGSTAVPAGDGSADRVSDGATSEAVDTPVEPVIDQAVDETGDGSPTDPIMFEAGVANQVTCGGMKTCDVASMECCITYAMMCPDGGTDAKGDGGACTPAAQSATCETKGTCAGNLTYSCDGPEDCPGGSICCARLTKGGGKMVDGKVVCEATCTGAGATPACRGDADCPLDKPVCCPHANGILNLCQAMPCK